MQRVKYLKEKAKAHNMMVVIVACMETVLIEVIISNKIMLMHS